MKKIKYEEASYIRNYKDYHFGEKYLCNWYIQKINEASGRMDLYVKWWFYLLIVVPIHIVKLFDCMWDGGLKEFEFESRRTTRDYIVGLAIDSSETEFGRFKEVWERYEED